LTFIEVFSIPIRLRRGGKLAWGSPPWPTLQDILFRSQRSNKYCLVRLTEGFGKVNRVWNIEFLGQKSIFQKENR